MNLYSSNTQATDDIEIMKKIHKKLTKVINSSQIDFLSLDIIIDKDLYAKTKSYRSNVTEGNKTIIGEYTKILNNIDEVKHMTRRYTNTYDDQSELINLYEVYKKKYTIKLSLNYLQQINYDLGKNIENNSFNKHRGKFRNYGICFIDFKTYSQSMNKVVENRVEFVDIDCINQKMKSLLININQLPIVNTSSVLSKAIIFHNEFLSIHPFIDGNGRTARVIFEQLLEDVNIIPYTPFSVSDKKDYQNAMSKFTLDSQYCIIDAYVNYAKFIVYNYQENVSNMLEQMDSLSKRLLK